jgi:hypothetical protein
MNQQGFKTRHIAEELGLPHAIVRKFVKALLDPAKGKGG